MPDKEKLTMPSEPVSLAQLLQNLLTVLVDLIPKVIAAVVIFLVTLYIATLLSRSVRRALQRRTANPQPVELLAQLAYYGTAGIGLILALQQVGFNVTAFLAGLGIAGFAIGFALQDVSKNFIAGLLMLIQQPFSLGETIEVSGFTGKVISIDLRSTQLRTLDGRLVLIPNGDVFINPITNFSRSAVRRVDVSTKVAYESDLGAVRQAALSALVDSPGLMADPVPDVNFTNFDGYAVDLTVSYWIDTGQVPFADARDAGLQAVKQAFESAGIEAR
jgi:small conductance mechanosensitive channel